MEGRLRTAVTLRSFALDTSGQENVFVAKFAADASLVWQRRWNGPELFGNDQANDVAVAPDGSVYVTGSTFGGGGDALILKFSPEGSLVWQQRWGGSGLDRGEAVAVAADGSIYVTGGTSSFGVSLFVLKPTPDGALIWQKTWGPATGEGIAVAPTEASTRPAPRQDRTERPAPRSCCSSSTRAATSPGSGRTPRPRPRTPAAPWRSRPTARSTSRARFRSQSARSSSTRCSSVRGGREPRLGSELGRP